MKKIILCSLALLSIATGFSQEEKGLFYRGKKVSKSVGLNIQAGHFGKMGVFIDQYYFNEEKQQYSSTSVVLNYAATSPNFDSKISGTGFEAVISTKKFFTKNKNYGFYYGNGVVYGDLKFKETGYNGNYKYISLFAPEIGYDFFIAKKIRVNLLAGTQWQIEIKGKGDVDNKEFDNWVHRLGLKVSYDF